jgi:hypothetical protein
MWLGACRTMGSPANPTETEPPSQQRPSPPPARPPDASVPLEEQPTSRCDAANTRRVAVGEAIVIRSCRAKLYRVTRPEIVTNPPQDSGCRLAFQDAVAGRTEVEIWWTNDLQQPPREIWCLDVLAK